MAEESPNVLGDQESLFSLEVVVDKIRLPRVVCRFPAVAFRLLDFPTLLIYHVEPDLAQLIKEKLSKDLSYKVPDQLQELKDSHGNFLVKKGKSSLFKVPLKTLESHLSNAPLYVMVIDTYPETPKLIGSCAVPLDGAIRLISEDVENLGLSVPSVHGEKGEYSIFNLMGSEIGKLELGFRLLSLGMGLMSHIPDNGMVKFKQNTVNPSGSEEAAKASDAAGIVLRDIQAVDKPVQMDMLPPTPTKEQNVQTTNEEQEHAATQTTKRRHKERGKAASYLTSELFVSNTVCPPPLFYNSEAEPKIPGLTFSDGPFKYNPASVLREHFVNGATSADAVSSRSNGIPLEDADDNYSEFSDSTIRHEDKFSSDSELENADPGDALSKRTPLRKTILRSSPEESRHQLMSRAASLQTPIANMAQFPLINELLREIAGLQTMGAFAPQLSAVEGQPAKVRLAWETPRSPKSSRPQETKDEFLQRLATPRLPQQSSRKSKSWLRKEPTPQKKPAEYGVKKTKLVYGLTNTQRLRLAKGNPEWLKMQERKEALRQAERKKGAKGQQQGTVESVVKPKAKQRLSIIRKKGFKLDLPELQVETEVQSPKQRRRPVPTPRLSLSGEKKLQQIKDHFTSEKERLIRDMKRLSHTPTEENESSDRSYHTAQTSDRSKRSTEVHQPRPNARADTDEPSTSADVSDYEETTKSPLGVTKVLSGPGFPRDSASRLSMVSSYSAQYSDDFEDDKPGNSYDEPGLRRVEEQHSESTLESAEEPSLRRVVDVYSDEGDEPSLRKVVDNYSDDNTDTSGKEPSLRKVMEQYSSDEQKSSRSYQSARSNKSSSNEVHKTDVLLRNLPMPNPTTSLRSPNLHQSLNASAASTRDAIVASGSSDSESDEDSSTARIPRSQMPSQSFDTGTSLDSTGEALWKRRRQPRPSPRRSLERIRTESVSSYNPSDPENMSPIPDADQEDMSEVTEEIEPPQLRYAKDMKVPSGAKGLGYTWT